jgi:hypothetical protein
MSKEITKIDLTTLYLDYWRSQDGTPIETVEERSNAATYISTDYLIIGFGGSTSIEIFSLTKR